LEFNICRIVSYCRNSISLHVGKIVKQIFKIQGRNDKTTIIIIGIVRIILGVFIPFIIFAELGLLAGYSFHSTVKEFLFTKENVEKENPNEEEHL
jgi:hypothetical protein